MATEFCKVSEDGKMVTLTMTVPRETRYTITDVTRTINLEQVADAFGNDADGFAAFWHGRAVQGWHTAVERAAASKSDSDEREKARNAKHKAFCEGKDDGRTGLDSFTRALRQVYVANWRNAKATDIKSESDLYNRCLDRALSALVVKRKVKASDQAAITKLRASDDCRKRADSIFAQMKAAAETIVAAQQIDFDVDIDVESDAA